MTICPRCGHSFEKMTTNERKALLESVMSDNAECVMEGLAIVGWKYKTDAEGVIRLFPVPLDAKVLQRSLRVE